MDPWMDAAHRGVTALAERGQDVMQAAGLIQAKGLPESPDAPVSVSGQGSGAAMPEEVRGKMETAFGTDFSSVRIHEGPHTASLGARAYTQGTDIHFAPGQYQPHSERGQELLGHELTHVVQQSQGRVKATTQAKGMSVNDDAGLEREADEMGAKAARQQPAPSRARAVGLAASESSEPNEPNGPAVSQGGTAIAGPSPGRAIARQTAIQRKSGGVIQLDSVQTHYGEFKAKTYREIRRNSVRCGVDIVLEFHPDKTRVDAKKIGLTQSVRSQVAGRAISLHPTNSERMVTAGPAEGRQIDQAPQQSSPLYMEGGLQSQYGWHYTDDQDTEQTQEARLRDLPYLSGPGENRSQVFETAALAVEGNQKDVYMGSVSWGWKTDDRGNFEKLPLKRESEDIPSKGFMAAAKAWNSSRTMGTIKTKADPTQVYNQEYVPAFTVAQDTTVNVTDMSGYIRRNATYMSVTIQDGGKKGKTGRIKLTDLKDHGSGNTIKLPIQWAGIIQIESSRGTLATLRKGRGTRTMGLADLSNGTRVKVMDDSHSEWLHVEIDTTQSGVTLKNNQQGQQRRKRGRMDVPLDHAKMVRGYVSRAQVQPG